MSYGKTLTETIASPEEVAKNVARLRLVGANGPEGGVVSTSGCEKYGKVVTSCQHLVNLFLFSSSFCSFYALHIVNMSIQLTPTKRQRIAFRYTETRDSRNPPTMVQIGKEFGVATSTVSKTLRRWREHGTTYTLDRSGRPTKMSPQDKRRAVAILEAPGQKLRTSLVLVSPRFELSLMMLGFTSELFDVHPLSALKLARRGCCGLA
jgi:DNA-binding MarR family transcriptional regulator